MLLKKEVGYDEFLAQKIQKGLDDFEHGRYHTADQAKQRIEQLLARKEQELQTEMGLAQYA